MTKKPDLKYSGVNELQRKAEIDYRCLKPSSVYMKLHKLIDAAEDYRKKGDRECQYIMLSRWLMCFNWLKSMQEYKDDKMFTSGGQQINEVKKLLEDFKQWLDTRYNQQIKRRKLDKSNSTEKTDRDNEPIVDSYMPPVDGPETPTRNLLVGDNGEIINCDQLFPLVQDIYGRYLIIDIREKSEFENSRISSNKCVNIPRSKIKSGLSAGHFEKYLHKDKKALDLYRHRGSQYVDFTILMDWNTSSKALTPDSHLNTLRKILENCDPGIRHTKITILDGGYADWVTRYPTFTTNPNIAEPVANDDIADEMLDDIKYLVNKKDGTSKVSVENGPFSTDNKMSHLSWTNCKERMAPVHGNVHPGITGLKNLGNSCYMNSIIQCLSNTTQLAKYFTDNLYADDLNTSDDNGTQGQVVKEVAQVIKALWRGQYKSISPHDLKIAVGQYKLQFESHEQQDSHEFLTFLLDWMHNDLKKNCKAPLEMTVAEEARDKAMDSQKSIISDLFLGQLRSTITCSFCKQISTTYESFNSLTTSLPHSNRCTLNDCILRFVTGQKVIGWKCPKCQTAREAMQKFDFVKLAPVIVIHLNRFAKSSDWLEKRNTAVDFPLTGFNLKPHLVMDNTPTTSNMSSCSYSLYAMSNHYGTMKGGHYTAFCKNAAQNKWYKYDDQTVTEVTENQVRSQNTSAYLLFYTSFSSNIN